jgi:cell division protein FtsQ
MTVMEPRVAERRKSVSEDRARKRLKWILVVIVLFALTLGTLWLVRSPILSIREVEVVGAEHSDPVAAVNALDMGIGIPTIDVRGDAIAVSILEDPWVQDATVSVLWPGSIRVEVVERTPVAPVLAGNQWVIVGRDGGVIATIAAPSAEAAVVDIDQGAIVPGALITDAAVLGALEFIDHLSAERRVGLKVGTEGAGLIADVAGHRIRLGRPVDMMQKASVLESLLDSDLPAGSAINLIAPSRPAVANPQPEVETEE